MLSPDADEVFNKFLSRESSKKLKKSFGIEKVAISAAESVKDVERSAFLFFNTLISGRSPVRKETKPEEISVSKLRDITFYSFSEAIDANVWKGKEHVPLLKNLKEVRCEKCEGKGTKKCTRCNNSRLIVCEDCKGKEVVCYNCKGSGKITLKLNVRDVDKKGNENKKSSERSHQCSICFGSGKITCKKCGGTGKIVCYECKGNPIACRECGGVGIFYQFFDSLVPLKVTPTKEYYSFMAKKDEWMLKDKDYTQKLESVEAHHIQDPKKLKEKDLKELFGVISLDNDLKKCIEETRKTWENLQNEYNKGKSSEQPLKPISLVFLLRLAIITPKNKKFDIYTLGTKNRYSIMTNRF